MSFHGNFTRCLFVIYLMSNVGAQEPHHGGRRRRRQGVPRDAQAGDGAAPEVLGGVLGM